MLFEHTHNKANSVHFFDIILAFFFLITLFGCSSKISPNLAPAALPSPEKWAETCTDWDDWDKPGPPFRIFGNSYYVGTCGISAVLITSDEGHVLIDGSTEAGADIIAANIKTLGFSVSDVNLLLHSHEHFDHVAGLARLQQLSGALLLASTEAAPVLRTGVSANHDPQQGMLENFPPARVDGIVIEGEKVGLGTLSLLPVATPGHTSGALSWQWQSCEKDHCLSIVYADSLSPISNDTYLFSEHPIYVRAYRDGLRKLAMLNCDVLLAPHPSASKMRDQLLTPEGLVNQESCKVYAESVSKRLDNRIMKEQTNSVP